MAIRTSSGIDQIRAASPRTNPSVDPTTEKIKKLAQRHFELCEAYEALRENPWVHDGSELYQKFIEDLKAFSKDEASLSLVGGEYRKQADALFRQFAATRVPTQKQTLQESARPSIQRAEKAAQRSEPVTIQRAAQPASELAKAIEAVEAAVDAFDEATSPDKKLSFEAKVALAKRVNEKIKPFADIDDQQVRSYRTRIQELLTRAFPLVIPEAVKESAAAKLAVHSANLQKLSEKKVSECNSLQKWVDLRRQEDVLVQELKQSRMAITEELARQSITVDPNDMTWTPPGLGISVKTELSNEFETVAEPLQKLQEARNELQLAYVSNHYKSVDMGGGGDCLFHSIRGVDGSKDHKAWRKDIVSHMVKNRERYKDMVKQRIAGDNVVPQSVKDADDSYTSYLGWMAKQRSWGGEPEIQAFSDMQSTPVVIVQRLNQRLSGFNTVLPAGGANNPPVAIENIDAQHFQSLVKRS